MLCEDFRDRYKAHLEYLKSDGDEGALLKLNSEDLSGFNLRGMDFTLAQFTGCSFIQTSFVEANFDGTSFDGCHWGHAILDEATFEYCHFGRNNMHGVSITNTTFNFCRGIFHFEADGFNGIAFMPLAGKSPRWSRDARPLRSKRQRHIGRAERPEKSFSI